MCDVVCPNCKKKVQSVWDHVEKWDEEPTYQEAIYSCIPLLPGMDKEIGE